MYLVANDNQEVTQNLVNLSLLAHQGDKLAGSAIANFFDNISSNDKGLAINLTLFDEAAEFGHEQKIVFTADNSLDDIENFVHHLTGCDAVFFVEDFKDGRTFSLIRHLKKLNFKGEIYLVGHYGLDQAVYYDRSGATGFFVQPEQLETILKTLNDLKTAHQGTSVNSLPMFR